MVIVVVGLGSIVVDAKSDALVSGSTGSSSIVPDSTSGSSWPQNLSITAIRLSCSNYAQWAKYVEVYVG